MKHRITITLEGADAVAFEQALARFTALPCCRSTKPQLYAAWLLGRASKAYFAAAPHDITAWWGFKLAPLTAEEQTHEKLLEKAFPTGG